MIVTENITVGGRAFIKTYSDSGYMVERDGISYSEAIDPAELGRVYTETTEPVEAEGIDTDEASEADYIAALKEMGVEV